MRTWRKGNPLALLVGMQTGADTLEKGMEFPQKVKNRTVRVPGWLSVNIDLRVVSLSPMLYGIVESLHCTPETNITLYVN